MSCCYLFLLIWFVSLHRFGVQLCNVMYETRIIANLCYASRILREDGEWRIGHTISSVWTFTRLPRLFSYHDNYKENWTHFICYVDYVSIWRMSAEVILYDIMYMHLFHGFYLNARLLHVTLSKLLGLSIVIS